MHVHVYVDFTNHTHTTQGYNREKEYIASQGPLPNTVGDFWRLIWDHNIPTVVMLTNLMENMKVKCSQYWPNSGSQQYSNINVTMMKTVQQADFVIRHFQIKAVSRIPRAFLSYLHLTSEPGHLQPIAGRRRGLYTGMS